MCLFQLSASSSKDNQTSFPMQQLRKVEFCRIFFIYITICDDHDNYNQQMKCRIERAKQISIRNRLQPIDRVPTAIDQAVRPIHAHFTLRKHIFQRNRLTIQNVTNSSDDQAAFSQKNRENITIIALNKQPEPLMHDTNQKHAFRYCHNKISGERLHSKTQRKHRRQISNVCHQQNRPLTTTRINSEQQNQNTSFTPIGQAYRNLKKSTIQFETLASLNDSQIFTQKTNTQLNQSPNYSIVALPPTRRNSSYNPSFRLKTNLCTSSILKPLPNPKTTLHSCASLETATDEHFCPSPW